MKLSPRECAMLREMGVAWPDSPELAATNAVPNTAEAPTPARTPRPAAGPAPVPLSLPDASAWQVQTSWEALQSAVASCRRCGLCKTRRQTVFGVGHSRAHWMVVGEAPGEQEDRQGEPFVGAAGQLLDRMLAAIGLSRGGAELQVAADRGGSRGQAASDVAAQRVFITNTVKCRPPQNRNPDPVELAACEPVLRQQMAWVQPRLILAMGRFAAQQLLRSDELIGRLRGRVHRLSSTDAPWAGPQGVPVVVTYHPAYLLRNPRDKAKAWDDLCLALDTMAAASQPQ
ncbi:MAG: uracil-DNA glycosylase [Betaproteobacteria bacterium]|nr:uracil-DNA glycosylase [Betaproteobacteria bacterium]